MLEDVLSGIYILIAVLTLAGNSLTIAAIRKNPKLNTASNQFIYGLAIADLLVGFTSPYFAILHLIPFSNDGSYETFAIKCLLSKIPLYLSCTASVGHLVIISIDRYLSLVRPLQHKAILTKKLAWKIMAIIWFGSALISSVPLISNRRELPDNMDCMLRTITFEFYVFAMAPMFAAFLFTVLITYVGIYNVASSHTDNMRNPIQAISIVVGCFVICWTPFLVLLGFVIDATIAPDTILWKAFLSSMVPTLLNSMINPLIYAWKIRDFRYAFLRNIRMVCRCRQSSLDVSIIESNTKPASEHITCNS